MAFVSNTQQIGTSPALALRNLGLAPGDLMTQINQMNRMRPDIIPLIVPPPPRIPSSDDPSPEFTKFVELPTELRLKIWGHASFIQRNISIWIKSLGELQVRKYSTSDWITNESFESHEFITNNDAPPLLSVCRESRAVGLTHYQLTFGTSYQFSNLQISTTPRIYVNWHCDRICLLSPYQFKSHKSRSLETFIKICQENSLRYLALNVLRDQHWPFVDLTTAIHSLKEVTLFGSEVNDGHDASNLGFIDMKTLATEHPEHWKEMRNHSWAIRLETPRRDLTTFFELNIHKLQERSASLDLDTSKSDHDPLKMWEPPKIVTKYITADGYPERSGWAW
ncbi:uncharacterized protein PAC_03061 [Phialocephala subalpina]|uniref:2EXR domain-containing protein n=1 Tax=Phialocephala subalpina TaxID=576137 RepID=A0A1L7WKC4_9HELO|nr:uncharacterized protein PAC_03061 [Phialocephala subalpina]